MGLTNLGPMNGRAYTRCVKTNEWIYFEDTSKKLFTEGLQGDIRKVSVRSLSRKSKRSESTNLKI